MPFVGSVTKRVVSNERRSLMHVLKSPFKTEKDVLKNASPNIVGLVLSPKA
jgi:hypothetical protein